MPITEWEWLRAWFVVTGLNLVPNLEHVQEFRHEIGTEFVLNDHSVVQAPGEEVTERAQSIVIARDRITIQSDSRTSFVTMDYPRESGIDRLSEVTALVAARAGWNEQILQVGYGAEWVYEQDGHETAAGYLADRLFGGVRLPSRPLGALTSGWGRMSFEDEKKRWQVVLEPRLQDERTNRVYLSLNLHRAESLAPTKDLIDDHFSGVVEAAHGLALDLDKGERE